MSTFIDDLTVPQKPSLRLTKQVFVGLTLVIALLAFEVFNFDTTRFALDSLLGEVSFAGLRWATVLAIAFCAIDFAGLARIFTPEKGMDEPKEVWYLMGAWLLGATMNAVMTWWAVSLTLLDHRFGNEVLSEAQLLRFVPIFVAVLVWLTRILFIGAISIAGDQLFDFGTERAAKPVAAPRPVFQPSAQRQPQAATLTPTNRPRHRQATAQQQQIAYAPQQPMAQPTYAPQRANTVRRPQKKKPTSRRSTGIGSSYRPASPAMSMQSRTEN